MKINARLNKNYSKQLKTEKCNIQRTKFSSIFITIKEQISNLNKSKTLKADAYLDMLYLNSMTFSFDFLNKLFSIPINTKDSFSKGNKYNVVIDGLQVNFTIMIYYHGGNPVYQIQINPKQYNSSKDLIKTLELIYGQELKKIDYKISRADLAFLIEDKYFNTSLLIRSASFPWKRTTITYNQNIEELIDTEVGHRTKSRSSNPSIYSNSFKRDQNLESSNFIPYTKFEYQIRKNDLEKNSILKIEDLNKLSSQDVFKKIKLFNPLIGNINNSPNRKNFILFQKIVANTGWHNGIKFYNKKLNKNFKQSLGHIVVPLAINNGKVKVITCLRKRYREWYSNWHQKYNSIYSQPQVIHIKSGAEEFYVEVSEKGYFEFSNLQ